jgi:tRNA A-37 threonylcarbamoyl transferase component Bud32/Tfp pilus assembly protein PilF
MEEIPSRMGRYRIVQKLGAGGMGVVYEAEDLRLRRRVALKFLAPELSRHPELVAQMEREARAASALNHPNICTIYDIDESDGELFIVMELLEGRTVAALAADSPLPIDTAVDIARQLADALDAAHRSGIVHRDIKPANVFVTRDGTVKVLDFGLAKMTPAGDAPGRPRSSAAALDSGMSASVLMGTPSYIAPERVRGEAAGSRSDLFSFGCVLYEMTTGRRAFAGEGIRAILDNILDATPAAPSTLNPSLPASLEAVIQKLLEKDPQRRYDSASQVSADLKALGTGSVARGRHWPMRAAAGTAAIATLTAVALIAWAASRPGPALERNPAQHLLIGLFENRTSEAVFDGTLQRALTIALEQSPYVQTVPDARVRETLQMMQHPPDEPLSPQLWRELCERLDARTLVNGWIAPLGTAYVIGILATGCSGDTLAAKQLQVDRREHVIDAVQRAADDLRRNFGEPPRSLEGYNRRIQEATTASLEALRVFSAADTLIQSGRERDAITMLERAVQLDPAFALAHQRIATLYRNLGVYDRANQHAQEAYNLRTRTTEREKLIIEQRYHREVTGDWARLEDTLKVLKYTFPRDTLAPINLGVLYSGQGRLEEAIQEARAALAIDPKERLAYENLSLYLVRAGKLSEATAILQEQARHGVETVQLHWYAWTIAEMTGNQTEANRELAWLRQHDTDESRKADQKSAVFHGRFEAARDLVAAAAAKDIERSLHETAALRLTGLAAAEALAGDAHWAKELCRRASKVAHTPRVLEDASLPLGLVGSGEAREMLEQAQRDLSGLMVFRRILIPIDNAALALGRERPDEALRAIAPVTPYEFGEEAGFYPAYIRVLANLKLGRPANAVADAQKIIDRRGVDPFNVLWVLAHLQQARAAAKTDNVALSVRRYEDFLRLWQDADRDLAIVAAARRELATLRKKM